MTPGARIAAAISVLDAAAQGAAVEQALTRWARASRFAGSKDRAAVRDHVFDAIRQRRIAAFLGGGTTGRAMMIGLLRHQGIDPQAFFTGEGHAPPNLTDTEQKVASASPPKAVRWNLPDWIIPEMEASLGSDAEKTAIALQARAPVCLRVNTAKANRAAMADELAAEGIETVANPLSPTALTVLSGERRVRQSDAYLSGRAELQDAASQAVVDLIPEGARCLDMCAGGGGKSLGLAAQQARRVFAHDIDVGRMADLPARAARAGVRIEQLSAKTVQQKAPFDIVLCDAPCSGSGAWRRAPEGKWSLTPARLAELTTIQDAILDRAAGLLTPGGTLVYATCSVLAAENEERVAAFLDRHTGWKTSLTRRFDVSPHGDGFFTAHLTQE